MSEKIHGEFDATRLYEVAQKQLFVTGGTALLGLDTALREIKGDDYRGDLLFSVWPPPSVMLPPDALVEGTNDEFGRFEGRDFFPRYHLALHTRTLINRDRGNWLNMFIQLSMLPKVATTTTHDHEIHRHFHRIEGYTFAVTSPSRSLICNTYDSAAMYGDFGPGALYLSDFLYESDWYQIDDSTPSVVLPYMRRGIRRDELLSRVLGSLAKYVSSFPENYRDPIEPQIQEVFTNGYMSVVNPYYETQRLMSRNAQTSALVQAENLLLPPQKLLELIHAYEQGGQVLLEAGTDDDATASW